MHSYEGLLVPRGSKLALLKSTFKAENFIFRLSWSISSDFDVLKGVPKFDALVRRTP